MISPFRPGALRNWLPAWGSRDLLIFFSVCINHIHSACVLFSPFLLLLCVILSSLDDCSSRAAAAAGECCILLASIMVVLIKKFDYNFLSAWDLLSLISCVQMLSVPGEASLTGFFSTDQQELWYEIQNGSRCKIPEIVSSLLFFLLVSKHYLSDLLPPPSFLYFMQGHVGHVLVWLWAVTRLWDTDNAAYFGECASIPDLHGSDHDSQYRGEENDWKSHWFPSLH